MTQSDSTHRATLRPRAWLISIGIVLLALVLTVAVVLAATSVSGNFPQCTDKNLSGTQCDWVNGNLVGSHYVEGTGVPQTNQLEKLHSATGSTDVYSYTWTTTFSSNSTHHGYDWIMSYDQASRVHQDYLGAALDLAPCTSAAANKGLCASLRSGPYSVTVDIPDDTFVSGSYVKNGNILDRIQAFEAKYGNREIKLYTDQPITGTPVLTFVHTLNDTGFTPIGNGGDAIAGATLVRYTLYFTTSAETAMIEYAAHFGISGDPYVDPLAWGYDTTSGGYGAGGLTGSNWHVKDFKLNNGNLGTLGSQDNQAGVTTNSLYPISSTAAWDANAKRATDVISLTTDSNATINGTMEYWVCGDTTVPYTDTLTYGCTSTTTATYVGSLAVTPSGKTAHGTSPVFTPTVSGRYCFLTIFTPAKNGSIYDFGPTADTNATTECFMAFGPNAVTLSKLEASVGGDGAPIAAILLSLLAVVAGLTIWKLKTGRRQSTP
jgi:hypothetical protein